MNLKNTIIENKPRENAGARSSSRFDYQKDWSICQLLDFHNEKSDYLFVFDYQEDLMIMDSESNPQKVSFYQIKGKKNKAYWTLTELLKSPDSKKNEILLSIIGKLYDCKLKTQNSTESLNFVSNIGFKVGDKEFNSLDKKEICIIELNESDKQKINNKLTQEHPSEEIGGFEEITFLKVVELNLDDSPTYTKGKIADFLDERYPKTKHNIPLIYQHLFNEVKRKSNYNKDILSYEDLIQCKGIGKIAFQEMLDICGASKDFDYAWRNIETILSNEGIKFSRIKKIKKSWDKVEIERMEPNNSIIKSIVKKLSSLINSALDNNLLDDDTLLECVDKIMMEYKKQAVNQSIYDDNFIEAIILSELYE
jgi:hypothetical protein